jgi:hypothetical protein
MKKNLLIINWALILCIILSACTSVSQDNKFPTETDSPKPTDTPVPTFSATPTQISLAIPEKYEFPSWLSDPNFQVFAMVTDVLDTSNEITFVNANTHDKFSINVPTENISRYFWTPDGKKLGFIQSDFLGTYLIELKTGLVTESIIPEDSSQCLFEYEKSKEPIIKYFRVESSLPTDSDFLCSHSSYNIFQEGENEKKVTVLENPVTGQTIKLAGVNASLVNLKYSISPLETQLAILQGTTPDPDERNPIGTTILIYELPTGEVISSYTGQFCSLKWSPDNEKLLTTQTSSTGCGGDELPAIIFPKTNQVLPITAIENTQNSWFNISIYDWSQDSNFLYYAYTALDRSDVCRYELKTNNIHCPTSQFDELDEYNVESYKLSPDEKFLILLYGYSCQSCDYWGEPSSALMNIDGSDVLYVGKEIYRPEVNSPYPYNTLVWRPIPIP